MKLWIFSDLHLEFSPLECDFWVPDADVCVVPGDISVGGPVRAIQIVQELVPPEMPVVFVAGNHDYYRSFLHDGLNEARSAVMRSNFHFLENDSVKINDVVFAGATLWTDFDLHGAARLAMPMCGQSMNDYRTIRYSKRPFSKLRPVATRAKHIESKKYLADFLEAKGSSKTVVVTHHAPSPRAIPQDYYSDLASAAYASNLDPLIADRGPTLWVHGHVHEKLDYRIGATRIVSNPRGYAEEPVFRKFEMDFVTVI